MINRSNADWVSACQRIHPDLLVAFLKQADQAMVAYFRSLDPLGPAPVAVSWAGETASPAWFDIAREYTEKWLHQQHIREATRRPVLTERRWLFPVLDTFARALPYAYRTLQANEGNTFTLTIEGPAGGHWTLVRQAGEWVLFTGRPNRPTSQVSLDADSAWRMFTRGIDPNIVASQAAISGDPGLARPLFSAVAIMA